MMQFRMIVTEKGARHLPELAGAVIIVQAGKAAIYRKLGWTTEAPARPAPAKPAGAYMRRDLLAAPQAAAIAAAPAPIGDLLADPLAALRAEYETLVGQRPHGRWSADTLRARIAAARSA